VKPCVLAVVVLLLQCARPVPMRLATISRTVCRCSRARSLRRLSTECEPHSLQPHAPSVTLTHSNPVVASMLHNYGELMRIELPRKVEKASEGHLKADPTRVLFSNNGVRMQKVNVVVRSRSLTQTTAGNSARSLLVESCELICQVVAYVAY
jgi:hypothetical protein